MQNILHRIKMNRLRSSFVKEDEFDPRVYNDSQYQTREYDVYSNYGKIMLELFKPVDYMDIGCANGFVSDYLQSKGVDAFGIEGADAAFKYMPSGIIERILKLDLREDWTSYFYDNIKRKYEVVNFTEVAEHLKPEYEDVMINNVKMLVGKYLVMSWSNKWCPYRGTEMQEHFNPREKKYVISKLKTYGFEYQKHLSLLFNNNIKDINVYDHWKNSIMIFKV